MVKISHRQGMMVRWFKRCPECKTWGGLQVCKTEQSISGKHRDYECRACDLKLHDWQASDTVQFGMLRQTGWLICAVVLGLMVFWGIGWTGTELSLDKVAAQSHPVVLYGVVLFMMAQALLLYRCWHHRLLGLMASYLTLLIAMQWIPGLLPSLGIDDYVTYIYTSRIVIVQLLLGFFWCVVISRMLAVLMQSEPDTAHSNKLNVCLMVGNLIPFLLLKLYRRWMKGASKGSPMLQRKVMIVAMAAILIPGSLSIFLVKDIQSIWQTNVGAIALERMGIHENPSELSRIDGWYQLLGVEGISPKPETAKRLTGLALAVTAQASLVGMQPALRLNRILRESKRIHMLITLERVNIALSHAANDLNKIFFSTSQSSSKPDK